MSDIEYGPIKGINNAIRTQLLTLQDVKAGKFENPLSIANPLNPRMVGRQIERLNAHPENYVGGYINGRLDGYLKTGIWTVGYEKDFATQEELELLEDMNNGDPTQELKLAIYGLVTNKRLDSSIRDEMTGEFLYIAKQRAIYMGATAINSIFHTFDPAREIAEQYGFEFTGRRGRATNVESVVQDLFTQPLNDK